jgi:hypothetical protein
MGLAGRLLGSQEEFSPISSIYHSANAATRLLLALYKVKKKTSCEVHVRRSDRLCGLVVRVSAYRFRGPEFDKVTAPV